MVRWGGDGGHGTLQDAVMSDMATYPIAYLAFPVHLDMSPMFGVIMGATVGLFGT